MLSSGTRHRHTVLLLRLSPCLPPPHLCLFAPVEFPGHFLMQGVSVRLLQCGRSPALSPRLSSTLSPPVGSGSLDSSSRSRCSSRCTGLLGMQQALEAWRV
uniref:Uncharacterized protein n=1 Tax=Knipowitschia caucasica TaxID=637954 RepID=A0AAV2J3A7_KNICA